MFIDVIACVLKKSKDYDVDYVEQLVKGLNAHTPHLPEIVCLSDEPNVSTYCTHLESHVDYPSWWCKLELFVHPELKGKNVLYFDLDTVIKGDISNYLNYEHEFTMIKDFLWSTPASGVMAWSGDQSYLLDHYDPKMTPPEYTKTGHWGDQDFLKDHLKSQPDFFQDLFPNTLCSYKLQPEQIPQSSIVCFHGRPRPRQVGWNV